MLIWLFYAFVNGCCSPLDKSYDFFNSSFFFCLLACSAGKWDFFFKVGDGGVGGGGGGGGGGGWACQLKCKPPPPLPLQNSYLRHWLPAL